MNGKLCVYAIRHNVTNRVYIGSSSKVDQRFKNHMYCLRGGRHPVEDMQADFDKYGEDYTFTILEDVCYSDKKAEFRWMEKYQSYVRGVGYNYKDHYFSRPKIIRVTFDGKTKSIRDWSDETGLSYETIYARLFYKKWDVEKALTTLGRSRTND